MRGTADGLVRVVHPFPSLLDGAVTAAIARMADGDFPTALRLGIAMLFLQASIGALNDLVDAPRDAGRKPGKPIPRGLVSTGQARAVVAAGAAAGLLLAVPSGTATVMLAVAILAIGYGYDLRAKGTAWSWLPFAVGIPLLPVFAVVGVSGRLPAAFAVLLPAAVAAGAALAIANARADLERDQAAGAASIATRFGEGRSWLVEAALLAVVVVVAIASLAIRGAPPAALGGCVAAGGVVALGSAWGRDRGPSRRQRGWEFEAVGIAVLAAAWLAGYGDLG